MKNNNYITIINTILVDLGRSWQRSKDKLDIDQNRRQKTEERVLNILLLGRGCSCAGVLGAVVIKLSF